MWPVHNTDHILLDSLYPEILFFILFLSYCFSLDKALNSLGYKFGYALLKPQLPNPINIVMVYAQRVSIKSVVIIFKKGN